MTLISQSTPGFNGIFSLEVGESTRQAPTKHAVSFKKALTSLDRGFFKKANRRGKISYPIITVQDSSPDRRGKERCESDISDQLLTFVKAPQP